VHRLQAIANDGGRLILTQAPQLIRQQRWK